MQHEDLQRALRIAVMQGLGMTRANIEAELWKCGLGGAVIDVRAAERLLKLSLR